MAIYSADPNPSRGGGLGLLRTAMSLWEHFREGGGRDQERAALESRDLQNQRTRQEMDYFNWRRPVEQAQENRAAESHANTQKQNAFQLEADKISEARKRASGSVGFLPDLSSLELTPAASEFGSWQGASAPELKHRLERTPYAELNDAEKSVAGQVPGQFANLSPLDFGTVWDQNVGTQTGGQRGIATTGTSRANGVTSVQGEPVEMLRAKAGAEQAKTDAAASEAERKTAADLLAKFRSERSVQNYYTSRNSVDLIANQVKESARNPTGANDIAILTEFMRSIDPESTVREGEFNLAARSGGVPSIVLGYYHNLIGQGRLTQPQREEILSAAARNAEAHAKNTEGVRNLYVENAQRLGLGPGYFEEFQSLKGGPQPTAGAGSATPQKFRSVDEAKAAGIQPGQTVLIEVPGQGWEEVTVGADGTIPSASAPPAPPQTPEASAPGQLPNVDFNALMMGRGGVGYPRPQVQAQPAQVPPLDLLPQDLILQYPGIIQPPVPQPRQQLNPARR